MTIEKEPPGLWFVVCDKCGERCELDTDPDDTIREAVADVKELGWRVLPPSNAKFTSGHNNAKYTVTYYEHHCKDCR